MAESKRMPVLTAQIEFDGDYSGFSATVRTNPAFGVKMDLSSGDNERFVRAVRAITVAWDVNDEAGLPIAPPSTNPEYVNSVPDELLAQLVEKYIDLTAKAATLPKA